MLLLSAKYFCVISFCLIFYVCGLLSAGCRIIVLLSGVCPQVGEVGPVTCVDFVMEGTGAYFLVGGVESFSSDRQVHVRLCIWGIC